MVDLILSYRWKPVIQLGLTCVFLEPIAGFELQLSFLSFGEVPGIGERDPDARDSPVPEDVRRPFRGVHWGFGTGRTIDKVPNHESSSPASAWFLFRRDLQSTRPTDHKVLALRPEVPHPPSPISTQLVLDSSPGAS